MARDGDSKDLESRSAKASDSSAAHSPNKPAYANPAYVNRRLKSASTPAGNPMGGAPFQQGFPPPPPPPPPFGMYPPPPPPPFGVYPPPEDAEYDEDGNLVEYVYEDDEVEEGEVPEDTARGYGEVPQIPHEAQMPAEPKIPEPKGKSVSLEDETVLELQRKGFEAAQKQARVDASQQRFRLLFYSLLALLLLSAITFGVYKFFDIFKPQRSLATYEVVERAASASWSLPEGKANDIVKDFYASIGGISSTGKVSNKVLTGSLHAGINVESFYCIQRGMRAYLKFNNPVYPKVFLLNVSGLAKQLASSSVTGDSTPVSESITLQLNGIVFFDELLHRAAFVDFEVNKQPYIYAGSQDVSGDVCDVIEMRPEKNLKISYFFSRKTKRIVQKDVDFAGFKARVEYSDYTEFEDGIFYPKNRAIYVNKTLFGNVVVDAVRFNKDVIFPR